MGGASIWHWVIVGVIVMLLFGRGKVSSLMGDVAQGIKAFKKGMAEDDTPTASTAPNVGTAPPPAPAPGEPVRTLGHHGEPAPAANATVDRKVI